MDSGRNVRNLDDIQEADPNARGARPGALIFASVGGALVVFASVLMLRTGPDEDGPSIDPLGDLVAQAGDPDKQSDQVKDVTFPRLLSDAERPTTALEVVRNKKAGVDDDPRFAIPSGAPTSPPPATDRLPVIPLPAGQMMTASVENQPNDVLTTMARHLSRDDGEEVVEAGSPGQFQLQVSSFKKQTDADKFAAALRRRGHRAYVEGAHVKGRGMWHRVRIGPFKHKRSAVIYRQDFEAKERIVTFVVSPPKNEVKLQ